MDSDSDFYGATPPTTKSSSPQPTNTIPGDEETITALQRRVSSFDPLAWWARNGHLTPSQSTPTKPSPSSQPSQPSSSLHNPYAGLPNAWQLHEPISDFLSRLPPSTTDWRPGLEWIFVANPHTASRYHAPGALQLFRRGGQERLKLFEKFQDMAIKALQQDDSPLSSSGRGKPPDLTVVQREVERERKETVQDLTELAVECGILAGKWMLFPEEKDVDEVWRKVVQATVSGELGIAAKVETRIDKGKPRLICIYTKDFRDKEDVARVLEGLRGLGLVKSGKQIYYKSGKFVKPNSKESMANYACRGMDRT